MPTYVAKLVFKIEAVDGAAAREHFEKMLPSEILCAADKAVMRREGAESEPISLKDREAPRG